MLLRSTKWLVVLALTLSLGAHWALLQSAAWFSMVVNYSQETSFEDAVKMTFDGEHPCKLCNFVQDGKKAEKERDVTKVECEKKFFAEEKLLIPDRPTDFAVLSATAESPLTRCDLPSTPPPRV